MRLVSLGSAVSLAAAGRFTCTDFAVPPMATTVDKLHPGHVEVTIAMGDSITAAFAADGELFEERNLSWSIGKGSASQITMPWLLQQYGSYAQPKITLQGTSDQRVVPNPVDLPHHDYEPKTCKLNLAQSEGSVGRNSLVEQWDWLQKEKSKYSNFEKGWKIFTVWMTANDVCGQCSGPVSDKWLDNWGNITNELLVNVSKTMSNVYVNLVSTLKLSSVANIQMAIPHCYLEHQVVHECGCIDDDKDPTKLGWLDTNTVSMNNRLHAIAAQWYRDLHAQNRTDMAVVVQGYQEGIDITNDHSFINMLDCFHPSKLAHMDLGIGLWDSMLCHDRVGRCGLHFSKDLPIICPNATSVFYTGPDVIPGPPP